LDAGFAVIAPRLAQRGRGLLQRPPCRRARNSNGHFLGRAVGCLVLSLISALNAALPYALDALARAFGFPSFAPAVLVCFLICGFCLIWIGSDNALLYIICYMVYIYLDSITMDLLSAGLWTGANIVLYPWTTHMDCCLVPDWDAPPRALVYLSAALPAFGLRGCAHSALLLAQRAITPRLASSLDSTPNQRLRALPCRLLIA